MTVSAVELALEGNLDMFVKSKKDKVRFPLLNEMIADSRIVKTRRPHCIDCKMEI